MFLSWRKANEREVIIMWTFGTQELISLIAAFATFCAIAVSLWLALKSKTIRFKVYVKNKKLALIILNTGEAKFTVNGFGIKNGKKYIMNPHQRFSRMLTNSRQITTHQSTSQEIRLGQVVMEQGDFVEMGLESFNYSILTKKSKFFIVVNCKVYKYKMNLIIDQNGAVDSGRNEYNTYTKKEVQYSGLYTGV